MEGTIDDKCPVQIIRGVPFPKSKRFTADNIESVMDYEPQDGDVIITSYPKTGTTWLQYIVLQIISKAQNFPSMDEASQKIVPFLELVGVAALDSLPKPRIYKHHIPYNLVLKNKNSRCIYIYRNPEDTVVSYYSFRKSMEGEDFMGFEQFFERFLSGNIEFGCYFKHVMSFYDHRDDSNLLLVSYEKLHANRKDEILRIARFLGEEHHQYLSQNEEVLNKIIYNTSFDSMKKNLEMKAADRSNDDALDVKSSARRVVQFFRKGVVGDGKNVLSEDQIQRIKEKIESMRKGSEIAKEWLRN